MPEPASPLDVLMDQFNDAPYRLAPERDNELRKLMKERNISVQFDRETLALRFEGADLFGGLGLVYVGIRGLERLWAFAYAIAFVQRTINQNGRKPFKLKDEAAGENAGKLMDWAISALRKADPAPWPIDLPRPQFEPLIHAWNLSHLQARTHKETHKPFPIRSLPVWSQLGPPCQKNGRKSSVLS